MSGYAANLNGDKTLDKYVDFLYSKIEIAKETGFEISQDDVNSIVFPHDRDAIIWAVRGGRRALFESFGMHKTVQELEWCRIITQHEGGKALIVLPLGVKQEFIHDAVKLLGMEAPQYVRTMREVKALKATILMTNYERVRDGDLDPTYFTATSLDEASVLRSFGSKTYQTFLDKFKGVPYKLVCTATPSPNKFKELIHYAGYLEVMDTGQALTRFFQRDSTKANNLTLYPHKEDEFWLWVSTWALFITKPSDIGYSDEGYDLPPLEVRYHEIPVDHGQAGADRDGQIKLLRDASIGLTDAAKEKRESIDVRVSKMVEIIGEDPDEHFILWHDLEAERHVIEETLPSVKYKLWQEYRDGNPKGLELYERHYSAYQYADGRERKLFCGPGEKTVLLTNDGNALFVWRKFIDNSGQRGINCAVFRNESKFLSSELIKEAMAIAWLRWPQERLYTYVNPEKVFSSNPGYCFKKAGWKKCGETQGGLIVLEALPGCPVPQVEPKRALESIYGSQDIEIREQRVIDFSEGRIQLFATKKELSGSGCNFQKHCHRAIFLGIDYQFNDFIQAIHRIYRFLQTEPVVIDIIYTESEREVLKVLKWRQHDYLVSKMTAIIKKYGLSSASVVDKLARSIGVERVKIETEYYTAVNNDCVLETAQMPDNSVDLIHTSIPFSNHYEYTPSYNDFGHNEDTARFFEQMDYLSPQLLRILKPGRVFACHVKDRVLFGNATGTGMPTIEPFHAMCIDHYMRHGFQYFGMITVITDVVRENNQTYRLGWSEQCKDGTKMGVGCPEYILLFRKLPSDTSRAYADVPVTKTKEEYTRAQWQIDAHGYWRSSGNRFLSKDELAALPINNLQAVYRKFSRETIYDYDEHVELAKKLDKDGRLPASFMVVAPGSWHEDVWDDINRMRTLNSLQRQKDLQMHVCLARDSRVLTREGYKPIQDVRVGEMVLTHKGRWRPVLAVQNTGVRPVVTLRAQGVPGLTLTPDHKLWTRDVRRYARKADYARKVEPEWLQASDTKGSYINLKLPPVEEPSTTDETFWWTIGRWLADGHIDKRGVATISVGREKWTEFCKNIGRFGGNTPRESTAFQVALRDPGHKLRDILEQCGHGAAEKRIPPEGYTLPPRQAKALLDGYLSGDGHYLEGRGRWMASSVSKDLLLGMTLLVQRVYGSIASIHAGRPDRMGIIEGRKVNMRQEWVMSFDISASRRRQQIILNDGAWKKVRSVVDAGEMETWNLRVAEDESYTAEGCIVKNCPLQVDLVERVINRYSNPGEVVFDPFAGLFTVPERAVRMGRKGYGIELNSDYFRDGVGYLKAAEASIDMPTLFDFIGEG